MDGPSIVLKCFCQNIGWAHTCCCRHCCCCWMGPALFWEVLSIILDGPTVAAETCCVWYWMGPQLPLRHAVDVNGWAQYYSEMVLSMILDGPTSAAGYNIERARHCLEMFCQWHWKGPHLPLSHVVYVIEWARRHNEELCWWYWMGPLISSKNVVEEIMGPSNFSGQHLL